MDDKKNLVLICVDGSEHSERAFNWYHDKIHRKDHEVGLVFVHVQPDVPSIGLFGGGLGALEVYKIEVEKSIEESKRVVHKYQNICAEKGVQPKVFVQTMEHSIGHTICKIAKEEGAVHIIAGSRGLGAVRRTFMGSVSSYILHHTHIPTSVIPPPDAEHQYSEYVLPSGQKLVQRQQ